MKLIKELDQYAKLREDLNHLGSEYTVFKAIGPNTEKTYTGYVKGTGEEVIRKGFMVAGNRQGEGEERRGVQQLINANGGSDDIEFEELAVVDTEEHAFMLRNEERETDHTSVTAPSQFPPHLHRSGMEQHPEIHQRMMQQRALSKCVNARQAWSQKFFNTADIKQLAITHSKTDVIADLDRMKPINFSKKYGVQIVNPVV